MTSYNISHFLFRFLTCPHCKQEYHYTTDGSGIDFEEEDFILWSFDVSQHPSTIERTIVVPVISRCSHCKTTIWAEEGVNTYCKRMEDYKAAHEILDSSSRPDPLKRDDFLQLAQDAALTQRQREKALREFWEECMSEYVMNYTYNNRHPENGWPPTPDFHHTEKLLPVLPDEADSDKMYKAELLRHLQKFPEAMALLKQVNPGDWKRRANYMIRICRKRIAHPVLIPPRTSLIYRFKKWVKWKWLGR